MTRQLVADWPLDFARPVLYWSDGTPFDRSDMAELVRQWGVSNELFVEVEGLGETQIKVKWSKQDEIAFLTLTDRTSWPRAGTPRIRKGKLSRAIEDTEVDRIMGVVEGGSR